MDVIYPQTERSSLPFPGDNLCVGAEYLVPSIDGEPIVPMAHEDNDHFNFTRPHYHIDSRFVAGREAGIQWADDLTSSRIEIKPFKCLRVAPEEWSPRYGMILISLYLTFHRAKHCGVCPHKGMPIQNGICSGHRLRWRPDGTCGYKGPFKLWIVGTANWITLDRFNGTLEFPIVEQVENQVNIAMFDNRDCLVTIGEKFFGCRVGVGETLKIQ